jgi:hypothetical protein
MSLRRISALLFVVPLSLTFLVGCGDEADLSGPDPFVCTAATCPQGACKLTVAFSPDCVGQIEFAEVVLNGSLEPQSATPTGSFVSVGDVPIGSTAEFYVRGASWQWGQPPPLGLPLTFLCKDANEDGKFTLSCQRDAEGGG